jgi:hypothetical protein
LLADLKLKRIVAYGAPAKGNTSNYFIGPDIVDYVG